MSVLSFLLNRLRRWVEDRQIADGEYLSQLRAVYRVKVER
jgi:hypothetical protein